LADVACPGLAVISKIALQQLYRVTVRSFALCRRQGGQTDKKSR